MRFHYQMSTAVPDPEHSHGEDGTNGVMDRDVDLGELAKLPETFLARRSAAWSRAGRVLAFNRHVRSAR